jgi:hypothetical protein
MVIPHPLDDLEQSLPIANCWLKKPSRSRFRSTSKKPKKDSSNWSYPTCNRSQHRNSTFKVTSAIQQFKKARSLYMIAPLAFLFSASPFRRPCAIDRNAFGQDAHEFAWIGSR